MNTDKSGLLPEGGPSPPGAMLIWQQLLVLAECISRARLLGAEVAASGQCDSAARIRLSCLRDSIEATAQRVWPQLGGSDRGQRDLAALLQCMDSELLTARPTLAADRYWHIATRLLDTVFEQLDRQLSQLKHEAR